MIISFVEFRECPEKIGIKPSPLRNPSVLFKTYTNQEERFKDNIQVYSDELNFLKDCFDCYNVMGRQSKRKPLDDSSCQLLMHHIQKSRFLIGDFLEEIRVFHKTLDAKVKLSYF